MRSTTPLRRIAAAALLLGCATAALGHEDAASTASRPTAIDAWIVALLMLATLTYGYGVVRLWRYAGAWRGLGAGPLSAFGGGVLIVVLAVLSPLDALAERYFSAHMIQHTLLMTGAAPLFVLARPLAAWAWGLPRHRVDAAAGTFRSPAWQVPWQWATRPLGAWIVNAAVLWLWHAPMLFDAALDDAGTHFVQHATFLVAALFYWWSVLGTAARGRSGAALASLFTTMAHTGALGALLALSDAAWYANYVPPDAAAPAWLAALEDPQLGGLFMWIPAGLVYVATALALARRFVVDEADAARAPGR